MPFTAPTTYEPNEDINQQSIRFTTYLNYLLSLSNYISESNQDNPLNLILPVYESVAYQGIQRKSVNSNEIGRLLRNSWFTELQPYIYSIQPNLLCVTNHWTPIQVYY